MNITELIGYLLCHDKFKNEVKVTRGEVVCHWDNNVVDLTQIEKIKSDTGYDFYILDYKFCFAIKDQDVFGCK